VIWTTACDLESKHLETDRLELSIIREQHATVLHVATKSDLSHDSVFDASIFVSVTENSGLDQLVGSMRQKLSDSNQVSRHLIGTTAARCQDSLARAIDSIHGAHSVAKQKAGEELVVLEIRESLDALGEILGTVYTDDILDRIFSKFCIGK
jgi:tRNA modification GTPase